MVIFLRLIVILIQLTKYLMDKYNIGVDKVVRHYDAIRKICPNIFSKDN